MLKGGQFLIAESQPSSIYTPEEKTEEQKLFASAVRDFVNQEIIPDLDKLDKMVEGLAVEKLMKAGELGLLGTAIPEEFGGSAQDFNTNSYVVLS